MNGDKILKEKEVPKENTEYKDNVGKKKIFIGKISKGFKKQESCVRKKTLGKVENVLQQAVE